MHDITRTSIQTYAPFSLMMAPIDRFCDAAFSDSCYGKVIFMFTLECHWKILTGIKNTRFSIRTPNVSTPQIPMQQTRSYFLLAL